jgi:hypothetical protein
MNPPSASFGPTLPRAVRETLLVGKIKYLRGQAILSSPERAQVFKFPRFEIWNPPMTGPQQFFNGQYPSHELFSKW